MRIEGQPDIAGTATIDMAEEGTNLRRYVLAVVRRWPMIVGLVALLAIAGYVTAPKDERSGADATRYYKATHVLLQDSAATGTGSLPSTAANPQQAAYLVNRGAVAERTAELLRIDTDDVTEQVGGTARLDISVVEITAVASTPESAVALADTSAAELIQYLGEQATIAFNDLRDEVLTRLESLKDQREFLTEQLVIAPGDTELQSQLDSVVNQYRLTYEQLQQLAAQPPPSAGLQSLETATASELSQAAFQARIERNLNPPPAGTIEDDPANLDEAPAAPPSAKARAAAGGLVGLILAMGGALVLDHYDTRVRRRADVEALSGLPVLAEIPPLSRSEQQETDVLSSSRPRSPTAEAYRVVRTAVLFSQDQGGVAGAGADDDGAVVIMVTSPGPDEGKTTSVANLATVFGEGGQSVLVVNCDFRRPRIHKYLTDAETPAVSVLDSAGEQVVTAQATGIPRVKMVTGIGERDPDANPIEIVGRLHRVVAAARRHFDVIILDTAPFLTTNDAGDLLPAADAVIIVARGGKTKKLGLRRTSELLRRLEANALGVILTGATDSESGRYYYYHYYVDTGGDRKRVRKERDEAAAPEAGAGA